MEENVYVKNGTLPRDQRSDCSDDVYDVAEIEEHRLGKKSSF